MVILSSCIFSCKSSLPDGEYELSLYSHGDIHGNWFTTLPSIAGEVNAERERIGEDKVIFIDLGDHNHGSDAAYYFNHIYEYSPDEEHVWSRVADYLKYDAVVVGNHDIEAGPDNWDKIKQKEKHQRHYDNLSIKVEISIKETAIRIHSIIFFP